MMPPAKFLRTNFAAADLPDPRPAFTTKPRYYWRHPLSIALLRINCDRTKRDGTDPSSVSLRMARRRTKRSSSTSFCRSHCPRRKSSGVTFSAAMSAPAFPFNLTTLARVPMDRASRKLGINLKDFVPKPTLYTPN
jgi:hypothetical protein